MVEKDILPISVVRGEGLPGRRLTWTLLAAAPGLVPARLDPGRWMLQFLPGLWRSAVGCRHSVCGGRIDPLAAGGDVPRRT